MKNVLAAVKLVLADLAKLDVPAVATGVAAIVAPIVAAVAGVSISPAELGGWLLLAGSVAATLQNLTSGRAAASRAPAATPPAAPPAA